MRLYLSSFGLGNRPEQLIALAGTGARAALIFNALDHNQPVRDHFAAGQRDALHKLGFDTEEIDLRQFFGRPAALRDVLHDKNLVWVNGGNVFILRRAMRQSGFDQIIRERLAADTLIYAGFSAGAVILAGSLRGLEITDDPEVVPVGYEPAVPWDGLGILEFAIAVHYQSDHPESVLTDQEIAYYRAHNIRYKALRDGEVLIRDGHELMLVK
jgi:dipeptidase E